MRLFDMLFLKSRRESLTGKLLYSDTYIQFPKADSQEKMKMQMPLLNKLAAMPFIGHFSGIFRSLFAVVHIAVHLVLALFYWEREHLAHVVKGCAEFVRGIIETLPFVGRLFAWTYGPPAFPLKFLNSKRAKSEEEARCFLVKITNPDKLDKLDEIYIRSGKHPFFKTPAESK